MTKRRGSRESRRKRAPKSATAPATPSAAWAKLLGANKPAPSSEVAPLVMDDAPSSAWEKLRTQRAEAGPGLWPDVPPPRAECSLCEIGADAHLHGITLFESGRELF